MFKLEPRKASLWKRVVEGITTKTILFLLLGSMICNFRRYFCGHWTELIVRQGGSGGGDDALAPTISHAPRWRLSRLYLFADAVVLGLSLTYIPVTRLLFS